MPPTSKSTSMHEWSTPVRFTPCLPAMDAHVAQDSGLSRCQGLVLV